MNKEKLEKFKNALVDKKNITEKNINSLKNTNEETQGLMPTQELSSYDNHPADCATDVFEAELNNGLKFNQEMKAHDIDDALKRIDKGTFGICAGCGMEIAEERLDILPFTKRCTTCEENKDEIPVTKHNSRPSEEDIIDAPFGRKYLNKQEDDENEGVDYLRNS